MAREFRDYSDRDFRDYSVSREAIIRSSPETRELIETTSNRRRLALMLMRMRIKHGLTQKEIAELAGWDKSFVSRLEGAQGGMPDLQTIAKFAEVCGMSIGIAALDLNDHVDQCFHIVDALTVAPGDSPTANLFQRFRDSRLPYYPDDPVDD